MNFQPLLKYISQYITLTEEEEVYLVSKLKYRTYLKGQYILQQGDVCKSSCFLVSGCTKTFHSDPNGQEHIIMFAIQNWWTSDMGSFITQTPADYSIQCLDKTEVIVFEYDAEEDLFKHIPKLERFFRIIVERAFVASQKRIIRNFSMTAKERYLYFKKQYPEIEKLIPQYLLASYLGITKEFLSKVKGELSKES